MGTTTNEKISQETEPTLQLKKPLLPIDEYAAREGISRDLVEECGELGIVQLRKYKGKTFVVDVPLSPYYHTPEITEEPTRPIDKTIQANKTSELVRKVIPDVPKTTDETEEKLELGEITQDNRSQFGLFPAQVKSKRIWQIAALFSIAFLFVTLAGNLWLYMDRKIQIDRLSLAYADIQTAYNNSTQLKQQVEALQNELDNSRAEVGRVQNELDKSRAEVRTVQNELARVKQNLKTIQERNAKAVERLNEQIQKLSDQPAN